MDEVTARLDPDAENLELQELADGFANEVLDIVLNQEVGISMLAVAHDQLGKLYGKIRDDMMSLLHDELKNDPAFDAIKVLAARHGLLSATLMDVTRPVETSKLLELVLESGELPHPKRLFPSKPTRQEAKQKLGAYFQNLAELPTATAEQKAALRALGQRYNPGVTALGATSSAPGRPAQVVA
jgi:hypothetical protein